MSAGKNEGSDTAQFVRRIVIVLSIAALFFLAWQLRSVLIMLFGSVVIATIFRAIADPVQRLTRIPKTGAVAIAILLVVLVLVTIGWTFGAQLSRQWLILTEALPAAWNSFVDRLSELGMPEHMLDWGSLSPQGGGFLSSAAALLMSLGGGVGTLLLVLFGGIFLSLQPGFYRIGAIKLIPPARRNLIAQAMDESERALRLWLKAQLVSMVLIGLLTGTGLWLIGVPSALVLGIIAGFLEFIPFAGPILAAIPGVLLGLSHSFELGLWALALYVLVQHAEAYLIYPMVQQWAVHIPAVVLLFSLLAFGMLFGTLGVLFAAPLTVVCYVLIKRLYVIEALDTPTPIPGEDDED